MRKLVLIAAALTAGVAMAPSVASAAGQTTVTRTTVMKTTDNDRRYHGGPRWHWKTVCTNKWRHGRKWRQCRKVRTRW